MNPRRYFTFALAIPFIAALITVVAIRVYWGYWITPPSIDRILGPVASIDRFTKVYPDDLAAKVEDAPNPIPLPCFKSTEFAAAGIAAFEHQGWSNEREIGSLPMWRLTEGLRDRGLSPTDATPISSNLALAVRTELEAKGLFPDRLPEIFYPSGPSLLLATGRDRANHEIVLAAFVGGEIRHDTYPYYEARFRVVDADHVALEASNRFRFDHAGLEGGLHWILAIGSALILFGLWALGGLVLSVRFVWTFFRRAGVVIAVTCLAFFLGARSYRGYFWPPQVEGVFGSMTSLDRFTTFFEFPPQSGWSGVEIIPNDESRLSGGSYVSSGSLALQCAARDRSSEMGSCPMWRIPAALEERGLTPKGSNPIDPLLLRSALIELERADAWPNSFLYSEGPTLHAALGRDSSGSEILLLAKAGDHQWNARYRYVEARFRRTAPERVSLETFESFWFDHERGDRDPAEPWGTGIIFGGIALVVSGLIVFFYTIDPIVWGGRRAVA